MLSLPSSKQSATRRFKMDEKMSVDDTLPVYSRAQLALRNGQDRDEIWVAYQGVIYELTGSRLWRNGKHYEHWAGQDLTDELPDAPHTAQVFEKFKAVGRLAGA
jgi:predicted heme/steroid binding protein